MRSRFGAGWASGLVDSVLVDNGFPFESDGPVRCASWTGTAPFRHRMRGVVVHLTLSFISFDGAYVA
ncbi:hypothetical protein GCM10017691_09880 [Pseudonocardia petroleophila]